MKELGGQAAKMERRGEGVGGALVRGKRHNRLRLNGFPNDCPLVCLHCLIFTFRIFSLLCVRPDTEGPGGGNARSSGGGVTGESILR